MTPQMVQAVFLHMGQQPSLSRLFVADHRTGHDGPNS